MHFPEEVLRFWFPPERLADEAQVARQVEWWFRGGADAEISQRFIPLLKRATAGELDAWGHDPRCFSYCL